MCSTVKRARRGVLPSRGVEDRMSSLKQPDSTRSPKYRIALMGTRGIPARYGGFETFAEQLSTRLVARGHQVLVYGRCGVLSKWGAREPIGGVERRDTPTIFHKYLETPLHAFSSAIDLLGQRVDAILLCNGANSPLAPILKCKRVPLVINVDGIERNRAKWNKLGKAWYLLGEHCSVWLATRIVSDAKVIAEYYKQEYGIDSTVIPYGVHPVRRAAGDTLKQFGLTPGRYILYVSRLEPENNALGVIEAYSALQTEFPLAIVGDAPYADEYKRRLRQAATGKKVVFTGFQFGEAYQEFQSNCYLYIQATEVGGTHPALIESMSYGNCVVSNGTPENIEVVGDAGVIFEKNNFTHLAAILRELLVEPQTVSGFGKQAAARAEQHYSWESVVSQYEQMLGALIAERHGSGASVAEVKHVS
jgi:glycosyltransferase involved in cell wall biosynthesis